MSINDNESIYKPWWYGDGTASNNKCSWLRSMLIIFVFMYLFTVLDLYFQSRLQPKYRLQSLCLYFKGDVGPTAKAIDLAVCTQTQPTRGQQPTWHVKRRKAARLPCGSRGVPGETPSIPTPRPWWSRAHTLTRGRGPIWVTALIRRMLLIWT